MAKVDREALQKRIVNFYLKNEKNKSMTVFHFKQEKIPPKTVYSILAKYDKCGTVGDLPRSGRPPKLDVNKVGRMFNNKDGVSQRKAARIFKVHQTTIGRTLKKCDIEYRKKEKAPAYTEKQLEKVKRCSRKLATKIFVDKDIILDDEKYFTLSCSNVPGNDGYYTKDKSTVPPDIRFKKVKKYEAKLLVWVAFSSKGICKPYFAESGNSINAERYLNMCLKPKLLPFLREHHADNNYIFWPDQAKAHYAKIVKSWLETQKIPFVEQQSNPPNVPQARPIEDLWGQLVSLVYEGGWTASTTKQLKRRITSKLKCIDINSLQTQFSSIRKNLRKIADKGPYSIV